MSKIKICNLSMLAASLLTVLHPGCAGRPSQGQSSTSAGKPVLKGSGPPPTSPASLAPQYLSGKMDPAILASLGSSQPFQDTWMVTDGTKAQIGPIQVNCALKDSFSIYALISFSMFIPYNAGLVFDPNGTLWQPVGLPVSRNFMQNPDPSPPWIPEVYGTTFTLDPSWFSTGLPFVTPIPLNVVCIETVISGITNVLYNSLVHNIYPIQINLPDDLILGANSQTTTLLFSSDYDDSLPGSLSPTLVVHRIFEGQDSLTNNATTTGANGKASAQLTAAGIGDYYVEIWINGTSVFNTQPVHVSWSP